MIASADVVRVYETLLSIPGMNENVKVTVQMSRKNILLLHRIIERGINGTKVDDKVQALLSSTDAETMNSISEIGREILHKAGLTEMSERMNTL